MEIFQNTILWQMMEQASPVVQGVMISLLLASFFSWIIIFQRYFTISRSRSILGVFEERFWSGTDLNSLFYDIREDKQGLTGINNVFVDGFEEFSRLVKKRASPDAIMEGVQRLMRVAINREEEVLSSGLAFLASVGSVSPYIGLFGTVWGIMNAFLGLASSTDAVTINVVAPGIAEALVATAMGLLAAIPAVLSYNYYSSKVDLLLSRYELFSDEFTSILHRRLHSSQ